MKTVLHLIPYDTIAGVETAARSVPAQWPGVRFLRGYLVRKTPVQVVPDDWHGPQLSENSLRAQWQLLRFAWAAHPDLIIGSLWRVLPVLIVLQVLRPKMQSVLFLHLARDVHLLDWALNRIAMWRATEIWTDSRATLEARVPARWHAKGRVLSFMTAPPGMAPRPDTPPAPEFIFWGRLQPQKDIPRALDLFAALHRARPDARLTLYGPDRGEGSRIRARIAELGLEKAVTLGGPLDHDTLFAKARMASFYLQTSREEGMAMSVIEAMALGLVPVVTPVGEIARYCRSGENAVLVHQTETAAAEVLALLDAPRRYAAMSRAARASWEGQPLYAQDFRTACDRLLGRQG